jgi:hypothetical protein
VTSPLADRLWSLKEQLTTYEQFDALYHISSNRLETVFTDTLAACCGSQICWSAIRSTTLRKKLYDEAAYTLLFARQVIELGTYGFFQLDRREIDLQAYADDVTKFTLKELHDEIVRELAELKDANSKAQKTLVPVIDRGMLERFLMKEMREYLGLQVPK